jgi:hypothetical protein
LSYDTDKRVKLQIFRLFQQKNLRCQITKKIPQKISDEKLYQMPK